MANATCLLLALGIGIVRLLAALISPYMPTLTAKILEQLQLPPSAAMLTDELAAAATNLQTLVPAGHAIGKPAPLISEIKDEVIEALRGRFGGNQAADAEAAAAAAAGPKKAVKAAAAGGKAAAGSKGSSKGSKEPEGPVDISRWVGASGNPGSCCCWHNATVSLQLPSQRLLHGSVGHISSWTASCYHPAPHVAFLQD